MQKHSAKVQIERVSILLGVFIGAAASLFITSTILSVKENEPDNITDNINGMVFFSFFLALLGCTHGYIIITLANDDDAAFRTPVDVFLFHFGYPLASLVFLLAGTARLVFRKVLVGHHYYV
ncbi:hypothetical protein B0H67DRAFT_557074 [Lasiosphaeris hirsuta]|uniref:Uncharacterized protein n=1 Tax=Lasiosphaeris hirsuta TaxID=260670 RepID=A0AA40A3P9_9PEZI|nr:hypothetical protein B0H67DRAFT_557074 [Lasiosphaeris hirsuta]